jgi:hypothetical protein
MSHSKHSRKKTACSYAKTREKRFSEQKKKQKTKKNHDHLVEHEQTLASPVEEANVQLLGLEEAQYHPRPDCIKGALDQAHS